MDLEGLKSREKDLLPSKIPAELPRLLLKAGAGFSGAELFPSLPPHPGVLVGRSDGGKVAPVGRAGCQWLTGEFEGCLGAFPKGEFGAWLVLGQG